MEQTTILLTKRQLLAAGTSSLASSFFFFLNKETKKVWRMLALLPHLMPLDMGGPPHTVQKRSRMRWPGLQLQNDHQTTEDAISQTLIVWYGMPCL